MLALYAAQSLVIHCHQEVTIYSDCQGAISLNLRADDAWGKNHPSIQLAPRNGRAHTITKVRSHPERDKPKTEWSGVDWGIYWADRLAKGLTTGLRSVATLSEHRLLEGVRLLWTFSVCAGESPVKQRLSHFANTQRMTDYLASRDSYRAIRGDAARWVGTTPHWAAKIVVGSTGTCHAGGLG
jgi:hypothetical protein